MRKMLSASDLFEEALKAEEIARACQSSGETHTIFFSDRDYFLAEAARMETAERLNALAGIYGA